MTKQKPAADKPVHFLFYDPRHDNLTPRANRTRPWDGQKLKPRPARKPIRKRTRPGSMGVACALANRRATNDATAQKPVPLRNFHAMRRFIEYPSCPRALLTVGTAALKSSQGTTSPNRSPAKLPLKSKDVSLNRF